VVRGLDLQDRAASRGGRGAGIRVLIVDDHTLFIDAIGPTLKQAGATEVLMAGNGEEALEIVGRSKPDLVLVDLGLPDRSGLAVGKDIIEIAPDAKVVALTALKEPTAVRQALDLGFHAYVTKDAPVSRFLSSLRAVLEGQIVVPPRLAAGVGGTGGERDEATQMLIDQLTPRELEVLALLVEGLSGPAIAARLSISQNTVRTHIQSILAKLQVHSRLEAAAFAVRHGLVRLDGRS
jgi:two-component system nitrate/nitrite response regulator NarL